MGSSAGAWDDEDLPDQTGRVFLITGATAGLGYFASEQLARAGAHVILSGRNPNRLQAARAALLRRVTNASTESILLDVTKSGSIRSAAATLRSRDRLDGVILNAGLVHPPQRRQSAEGHELVLQTNVLGHFALAGELLPALAKTAKRRPGARMVWLGSVAVASWRSTELAPELESGYSVHRAYVQSKFLTQALAAEADRRLREAGNPVGSVLAHPGYSLGGRSPGVRGVNEPGRLKRFLDNLQTPIAQSKELGAAAEVRALIDPSVQSGDMVGPLAGFRGTPRVTARGERNRITRISEQPEVGAQAWEFCAEATRTVWPFTKF
ncbi:SDR family NAD(P)-dependent oxidoreductase [Microbacterium gorillae]|uniref:SDR family NAD(P)-dependent oxidoreductase n=1 Tax=Microbacterium gorillae TaxID=1231063 RepID=UPI00058EBC7A|nr:SDR family NAD(P)-dependent oxidoreductase [Microbacterium gorillae]